MGDVTVHGVGRDTEDERHLVGGLAFRDPVEALALAVDATGVYWVDDEAVAFKPFDAAPRVLASLWIAICLYAGLFALVGLGFTWIALPAILWLLGHGALIGLTLWDPNWDEVAMAQLTNRYKDFYDAG